MLIVRHIKERVSIFYILKGKFRMALVYTACSRRINNGDAFLRERRIIIHGDFFYAAGRFSSAAYGFTSSTGTDSVSL